MGCQSSVHVANDVIAPGAVPKFGGSRRGKHDAVGLLKIVTHESLMALLSAYGEKKRLCVCSETDELLALVASFGSKRRSSQVSVESSIGIKDVAFPTKDSAEGQVLKAVDVDDARLGGFGSACHRSNKPDSPNQDSWFMLRVEDRFSMYGVFDGHGQTGHNLSNFVKDNLPKLIVRNEKLKAGGKWSAVMRQAFQEMQGMIKAASEDLGMDGMAAKLAGTTATVVVHDQETNCLIAANVGDSSACLASKSLELSMLTRDHKPSEPSEKSRIEKAGGVVLWDGCANYRVFMKGTPFPALNMSRCLGDLFGHNRAGLSAEPHVKEHRLGADDKLLVLGSDGLWDFMPPKEVLELAYKYGPARAAEAAEALAAAAHARWGASEFYESIDDITALVIWFDQEEGVVLI